MAERGGIVAQSLAGFGQRLKGLECRPARADGLGQSRAFGQTLPRLVQCSLREQDFADGEERMGGGFLKPIGACDLQGAGVAFERLRLTVRFRVSKSHAGERHRHFLPVFQRLPQRDRPAADRDAFFVAAQIHIVAAQIAQAADLQSRVADTDGLIQAALMEDQGFRKVSPLAVDIADIAQRGGDPDLIPGPLPRFQRRAHTSPMPRCSHTELNWTLPRILYPAPSHSPSSSASKICRAAVTFSTAWACSAREQWMTPR